MISTKSGPSSGGWSVVTENILDSACPRVKTRHWIPFLTIPNNGDKMKQGSELRLGDKRRRQRERDRERQRETERDRERQRDREYCKSRERMSYELSWLPDPQRTSSSSARESVRGLRSLGRQKPHLGIRVEDLDVQTIMAALRSQTLARKPREVDLRGLLRRSGSPVQGGEKKNSKREETKEDGHETH